MTICIRKDDGSIIELLHMDTVTVCWQGVFLGTNMYLKQSDREKMQDDLSEKLGRPVRIRDGFIRSISGPAY